MWMIRHAKTDYNKQHRYQGSLDLPLSEEGRQSLLRAPDTVERVYVSRLQRTAQTAAVLFPEAEQIIVPGLEEMDFGRFDGHTYEELREDPAYQAWVDSYCMADIPGGENRKQFSARVTEAVAGLIAKAAAAGEEKIVIVAHGGTIMSALEAFGTPGREYYEWLPENGEGYELEIPEPFSGHPVCRVLRTLSFRK